jgi:hypothetical protein
MRNALLLVYPAELLRTMYAGYRAHSRKRLQNVPGRLLDKHLCGTLDCARRQIV